MYLSILIPTLNERQNKFIDLLLSLESQASVNGYKAGEDYEIIFLSDSRQLTVGQKRNLLMSLVQADFMCFIDDDDKISANYLSSIIEGIKNNPTIDCIGLNGVFYEDGIEKAKISCSKKWRTYSLINGCYTRYPNHLNPIRTQIATQFKFNETGKRSMSGEDYDWATQLHISNVLNTEHFIDQELYHYFFSHKKSATQV